MQLTQKKSFYTLLIVSILGTLTILWFDYQLLFTGIAQSSKDILAIRKDIAHREGERKQAANFQEEKNQIRRERERIKPLRSFPDGLSFITAMENLAKISGTSLSFDVQGDTQPVFRVQANGNFGNILDFLERVGATPTTIQLSQISKDTSLAGQALLRADLTLTPFLLSPTLP